MKNDNIYLASNLKHLRVQMGKTQKDVGNICNKTDTAVSNWEKGIREPDAVDLAILSDFFNVSIDDLMKKDLQSSVGEYELNQDKFEQEIYFNKFKELSPRDREIVKGVIDSIIKEMSDK